MNWNGQHHPKASRTDREHCVRCGRVIRAEEKAVSLELNSQTSEYRDERETMFPDGESQGWFLFGATCAAKTLEEQRQRRLSDMKERNGKHLRSKA